jgi:hypothetical protein
METSSGVVSGLRRSLGGFVVMAVMLGTLAACTAPGSSAPATAPAATTLPAATVAATTAAASPKASTASPAASPVSRMASPVAAVASPEATPVERRAQGQATPLGETGGAQCKDFDTWWNDPNVKSALEKTVLWPEVLAEAKKAAAGEPVDTELMRKDYEQMAKVATALRETEVAPINRDTARLAAKAMGLVSRMAGALANNNLDKDAAAAALAEAKQAIADYDAEVAAQKARCG